MLNIKVTIDADMFEASGDVTPETVRPMFTEWLQALSIVEQFRVDAAAEQLDRQQAALKQAVEQSTPAQ